MNSSYRILVVDDWPDAAESMGMFLDLYCHKIQTAHDGAEALTKAETFKPDVVLLDVAMPRMTGLDVARMLAAQNDKKPLLVAISGYCSAEDKAAAYKAGFDHFFGKPIDLNELLHVLESQDNIVHVVKREMAATRGETVHR